MGASFQDAIFFKHDGVGVHNGQMGANVLVVLGQNGYGVAVVKVFLTEVTSDVPDGSCFVGCLREVGWTSPGF